MEQPNPAIDSVALPLRDLRIGIVLSLSVAFLPIAIKIHNMVILFLLVCASFHPWLYWGIVFVRLSERRRCQAIQTGWPLTVACSMCFVISLLPQVFLAWGVTSYAYTLGVLFHERAQAYGCFLTIAALGLLFALSLFKQFRAFSYSRMRAFLLCMSMYAGLSLPIFGLMVADLCRFSDIAMLYCWYGGQSIGCLIAMRILYILNQSLSSGAGSDKGVEMRA